jgi:hypothetical protein
MKKLKNILFLSCKKASELIEKKIHFRLSFLEEIRLKIHKSMCDACTKYEKQSTFLEKAISSGQKDIIIETDLEELKNLITSNLDKNSK